MSAVLSFCCEAEYGGGEDWVPATCILLLGTADKLAIEGLLQLVKISEFECPALHGASDRDNGLCWNHTASSGSIPVAT